ncbi:efflux RND transporter periplasmic adaptor subunit [Nitrosomonas oligotropha]|uniref:efflux RND transporter periplasmic adaptor subunit n=1 Tax=Nitrosomonas oligotropha TaxID=42354 RepID=UPI00136C03F7|nr:efflux RND transporter periplasmic adaptor subunit [Nitrosomonas oligotropha]MXS82721.1 efflux RND transporter periplasmic adaptor subunit [Nitrosomonas oligotropha]
MQSTFLWFTTSATRIGSAVLNAGAGLSLILLASCGQQAPEQTAPLPQVQVITVAAQTIEDEPEFIGQTEAFRPVEIRPQVSGIIKQVYFTEGRNAKKGDKLYLIDPVPFKAIYLSAKARVAQMQARLNQAKQDLARVKPLLEKQAVSKKNVDDAEAETLAAKASLEAAQNDLIKAKFDLDNTLITAPVNGRIGRSHFYEGRLVSAQETLLTTIDQLDPMYVNVSVPESYLLRRRRELTEHKVERPDIFQLRGVMTFTDGSVYPQEGVLDFADVALRPETGTLQGRFKFPNPEGGMAPGQSYFYPGQFVRIRIKGYIRNNAILIPQRAVQQGPNGSFVFVIDAAEHAQLRQVQASAWRGKEWLIESGLQPGERIVVEGFYRILPGSKVDAIPHQPEATAARLDSAEPTQQAAP